MWSWWGRVPSRGFRRVNDINDSFSSSPLWQVFVYPLARGRSACATGVPTAFLSETRMSASCTGLLTAPLPKVFFLTWVARTQDRTATTKKRTAQEIRYSLKQHTHTIEVCTIDQTRARTHVKVSKKCRCFLKTMQTRGTSRPDVRAYVCMYDKQVYAK